MCFPSSPAPGPLHQQPPRPTSFVLTFSLLKQCMTVIEAQENVWQTLTNVKMHSDYLRHILDK